MVLLFEGVVMCFVLLIVCVVGIAQDGPVGLVTFYEQDVQDRVVQMGLTTKERIRRTTLISGAAILVPMLLLVPYMAYGVNGAQGFWEGWGQMTTIGLISGLFDRIFIDWWWVGHTRAWIIPGTEDLQPYIAGRTLAGKWIGTVIGFPIMYALIALLVR